MLSTPLLSSKWRRLTLYIWWLAATTAIMLAIYVVLGRQVMAMVPEFRDRLIVIAEERFDTPLEIASLEGEMAGFVPRIVAKMVRLPAPDGEPPLELGEVRLELDVLASLWNRDWVLRSLVVRHVDLHLIRHDDGAIALRGLPPFQLDQTDSDSGGFKALLSRQRYVAVEQARLSLAWPGMPELAASRLDAALLNDGDVHLALSLTARDRPLSLKANGRFDQIPWSLEQLTGKVYLHVSGQDWQQWLPGNRDWPIDITSLEGDVTGWGRWQHGDLRDAHVAVNVPELHLQDAFQQWPLSSVRFNLDVQRHGNEALATLQGLNLRSPAGHMTTGDVRLQWHTRGQQRPWRVQADDLPVHALSQQFVQWPFTLPEGLKGVQRQVQQALPRGAFEQIYMQGEGSDPQMVALRFNGLHSRPIENVPGVQNVSGWLAGSADQGVAALYSDRLSVALPGLYDHSLEGDMDALAAWSRDDDGVLSVRTNRIKVNTPDAMGDALMALTMAPEKSAELRFIARIRDGNGDRAAHYIPLKRLQGGLGDWLAQAFQGGRLVEGQFLYQGNTTVDELQPHLRTFQMRFQSEDAALSFLPDWPLATGIDADVHYGGDRVVGRASKGLFLGNPVTDVQVRIARRADNDVVAMDLTGHVTGEMDALDRLFKQTPLRGVLPDAVADWRFSQGNMDAAVALHIPFDTTEASVEVSVSGQVSGAIIENRSLNLAFTDVQSPVEFTLVDGLQLPQLDGRWLGQPLNAQWHTRESGARIQLETSVSASALREWSGQAWLDVVSGTVPVGVDVLLPTDARPLSIDIASSLSGARIDLPAPFTKPADVTRPLQLRWRQHSANDRQLQFSYGRDVAGDFRQLSPSPWQGQLRVGERNDADWSADGISIYGRLEHASLTEWFEYLNDRLLPAIVSSRQDADGPASGPLERVSLQLDRLDMFGVEVPNAQFSALADRDAWDLAVTSPTFAANMRVPGGNAPLLLQVNRMDIYLPESVSEQATARLSPRVFPHVDARLNQVRVNGQDYGQWQGDLRSTEYGLRVANLDGQWRHGRWQGELSWEAGVTDQEPHHSRFTGTVESSNLSAFQRAWALPVLVESDDLQLDLDIHWQDWPLSPDYLGLQGRATLDIGECRIPEADSRASALRVLGVLNVATIQRRLRLDFTDLYKRGLSCDSIQGDFAINGPLISTDNLVIASPSAHIRAVGDVDLAEQRLDHDLQITLPLSSNLYAGCLAGPAACAGIFVVERIWGDQLDRTTTMDYQVRGPMQNPRVSEQ